MRQCPKCGVNNAGLPGNCVYCFQVLNIVTPLSGYSYSEYDHDLFLIRDYRIREKIGDTMTPQEALFAQFFNDEKAISVDILTREGPLALRAHREELAKIAFEARARITGVDHVEKEHRAKSKQATGFITSVQPDELATDAINKIKERGKKIDKTERLIQNMMKSGMDRKTAESLLSAGTIMARLKEKPTKPVNSTEPIKPVVNPFAKPEMKTEVTIIEETNTVVVTETEEKPFVNPFAKKG